MNTLKKTIRVLSGLCVAALFTYLSAAALPPKRTVAVGAIQLTPSGATSTVNLLSRDISPITITVPLTRVEQLRIRLTHERKFKGLESSSVKRILQGSGTYIRRGKTQSASKAAGASIVVVEGKDGTLQFHGVVETFGSRTLRRHDALLTFQGDLTNGNDSPILLKGGGKHPVGACATEQSTSSSAGADDRVMTEVIATGFQQLEVLLEGDSEFFSAAGASAITELTQIASLTDVIYRRDLNVTLLPTITTSAVPYAALFRYNDQFELDFFDEMRATRPTAPQDVHAVITGKTPPDSSLRDVAGIANDIGITCRDSSHSKTAVRRFSDYPSGVFYTFAHEVGHLIGGEHDDALSGNSSVGYIMNSGTQTVSTFLENFSQYSINQITQYFNANGSCLIDVGDAPPAIAPPEATATPTPESSLELEAELLRVNGKTVPVFSLFDGEEPVKRATLQVYKLGKTVKLATTLRTRADGYAAYKRATKGKYYAVLASDPSVASNVVNLRK